jgi:hypothetical protein
MYLFIHSLHPCNSPYGPAELLLFIPDKQAGWTTIGCPKDEKQGGYSSKRVRLTLGLGTSAAKMLWFFSARSSDYQHFVVAFIP